MHTSSPIEFITCAMHEPSTIEFITCAMHAPSLIEFITCAMHALHKNQHSNFGNYYLCQSWKWHWGLQIYMMLFKKAFSKRQVLSPTLSVMSVLQPGNYVITHSECDECPTTW
jgi:hypothetical protein